MVQKIQCSFIHKCENFNKKCNECKWNAENEFGDFLLIKTEDGKTLKFL